MDSSGSNKRNIIDVSPASSLLSPEEKRVNLELEFSTPTNMASPSSSISMSTVDVFADAPPWARALDAKISKQLELLTVQSSRIDIIENDLKLCRDIAMGAKDIAKEARDHAEEQDTVIEQLQSEIDMLKRAFDKQENYSRRDNLIIDGVEEEPWETPKTVLDTVYNIMKNTLKIADPKTIRIERCHRLGQKKQAFSKPRPVIIKFSWFQDRQLIWNKRSLLRGTGLWMREDFCRATLDARNKLLPYARAAQHLKIKSALIADHLVINDQVFYADNIGDIPPEINPSVTSTRISHDVLMFYGKTSPFSNFFPAPFTEGDIMFSCSEQYYQYHKAKNHNDDNIAKQILEATQPEEMLRLGKLIKDFDKGAWESVAEKCMIEANEAKYSQNPHLAKLLKETLPLKLAESSPFDKWWGTGKSVRHPTAHKDWDGKNIMGDILTNIREKL